MPTLDAEELQPVEAGNFSGTGTTGACKSRLFVFPTC